MLSICFTFILLLMNKKKMIRNKKNCFLFKTRAKFPFGIVFLALWSEIKAVDGFLINIKRN